MQLVAVETAPATSPSCLLGQPCQGAEDSSVCGFGFQGLSALMDLKSSREKRKRGPTGYQSHVSLLIKKSKRFPQKPSVLVRNCIWVFINETEMPMA